MRVYIEIFLNSINNYLISLNRVKSMCLCYLVFTPTYIIYKLFEFGDMDLCGIKFANNQMA